MKTVINGREVEGTPEEIARMIGMVSDGGRVTTVSNAGSVIQKTCQNCPNHPKNGGSGVCQCVLGVATFY